MTGVLPMFLMLARCGIGLLRDDSHLAAMLLDSRQLLLLGRSLKLAVLSAAVAFVLGFPVACILSAQGLPWRRLCLFFVLIPLLIPLIPQFNQSRYNPPRQPVPLKESQILC
jgi:ABC-type Fe3+ transport system permease subunit